MSQLWRYVTLMKVCHDFKGLSQLWRNVTLMRFCRFCHNYGGFKLFNVGVSPWSNELATLAQNMSILDHFLQYIIAYQRYSHNESNDMRLIRLVWIQRKKLSWWRRHHFPWPVDLITRRGRKKESSEHLLSLSLRPICNRSQSYRTLKRIDGVEVDNLHFLRICIVFLACRHPFISMHFVSSSMVKEPQLWRSLNFSQACLLWNSFQERETTTLLALRCCCR